MLSEELIHYIESHTSGESELLREINRMTNLKMMYPRMLSGKVQGKFLEMVSYMLRPETILEIGTFTGYSAICLAAGLAEGGMIHTLEADPEIADFAKKYFKKSGYEHKIKLHTGQALEIIPELEETFDLVFIDADKENYLNYFKLVLPKVKQGGFILADNVLWDGKVTKRNKHSDKETEGIREFNDFVRDDDSVENVLVSIRDGLMLIRKK